MSKVVELPTPLSHIPQSIKLADEKPLAEITLANLLQCSPEINNSKGYKPFSIFKSLGNESSSKFLNSSLDLVNNRLLPSSTSSHYNVESSKLSILDKPNYLETQRKQKLKRSEVSKKWPSFPTTGELTQESRNDFEALRLRGALSSNRLYKRNSVVSQPKYFQVGTIIESSADYYSSRVPKRKRKKTLAEEMVAEVSSTVSDL